MKKTFDQVLEQVKGKPILVANRGIPARRILRSISERFDAVPVLTATDVDKTSPATAGAGELMLLGADPRAYLDIDLIIEKAKARGVAAIHPGWGFASEDASFPAKCAEAGIVFIGSTAEAMHRLGNKVEVRKLAQELDIPVVPGSEGAVDVPEAREIARKLGFPVMLKAEGGGGGRGIYIVSKPEELDPAFEKATVMAKASFGNAKLFVEKYLRSVRHIEIQVVADKYGNVFAFDERDCTIQRNHQKLIEITPSPWPGFDEETRERLKEHARKLVLACNYHSLATVEFLVDEYCQEYLIEVNTRLQVEHGITECRYGIDLVEEQISIAFDGELRFTDENTKPWHHAMQLRVNCEDPQNDFAPNSGTITRYVSTGGPGVRLDSCLAAGYDFPPQYDSAGQLLIAYGRGWRKVLAITERALKENIIGGVKTTQPFYRQVLKNEDFRKGEFDTNFIAKHPELVLYADLEAEAVRLSKLVCEISAKGFNPYVQLGVYRNAQTSRLPRFEPVMPPLDITKGKGKYPRGDRKALLDCIRDTRDAGVLHFTDTTARDITQSNTGNRFRLAEDELIGPYLDNCGFFSLENGGGAHFHVAMIANMTYPFSEAAAWNRFAPKTAKQILIRSTNVLGYKPQPKNLMRLTGEMINEHYDVIRCFDFLNHIENMAPFAEVAMHSSKNVFQPAVALSHAPQSGFDVDHYMGVVENIVAVCAKAAGLDPWEASKLIILGLKDMAGVCPPAFMFELVKRIRSAWPELVVQYHRHFTDGLFVPACVAAAKAGCHIIDAAMGSAVRWYGQGDMLSVAAAAEEELGVTTLLDKDMIGSGNFVLKQIMPFYDRYCAPFFAGLDYEAVEHAMPGGATSSSQEGAMKQGYIHLLPFMLKFLAGTRKIVRYHDVTPGSQITWNTAFLAVTSAYKRGGEHEVKWILDVLKTVSETSEDRLTSEFKTERLKLYRDSNDAFRDLLMGKYGKLPHGFPADWVYESAFGDDYRQAIAGRTETSPLNRIHDMDLDAERKSLETLLKRTASPEEFVMYLNHPGDALKTIDFKAKFGDPNRLPLDVWFEGLEVGRELNFTDAKGKPHQMTILRVSPPGPRGNSLVRYVLDSEIMSWEVKVAEAQNAQAVGVLQADPANPFHIGSPSNGDLWVVYVRPGDHVKIGDELFNLSIMKQEKSVLSPIEGRVKRVLKTARYTEDKKMVPVKEGELIIELEAPGTSCVECGRAVEGENPKFCSHCGAKFEKNA